MLARRRFLQFLISLVPLAFTTAPHAAASERVAAQPKPRLVVHRGWVLKADDLQSS